MDGPVIFVSAYGQDQLIARAFDSGAADYLVKPFLPPGSGRFCVLGDLTSNYSERLVSLDGRPVQLADMEYRTLSELAFNAGQVLTYEHLLRRVWRLEVMLTFARCARR